ncbi:MAG: YHS domain-containing protein [Gammaproteobacteria bacterium]
MRTLICPTCGCSLVRLGINESKAVGYQYDGSDYYFCCQGCVECFITDPERYLRHSQDLVVCPTCLAEKPVQATVGTEVAGQEIRFCACPCCVSEFMKDPNYFIQRLEGKVTFKGIFGTICSG